MAIAQDGAPATHAVNQAPTYSFARTVSTGASLYVCVIYNNASDPAVTSATYNSVSMTKIATRAVNNYGDLFRLHNAGDGASHNVVITYTNGHTLTVIDIAFTGLSGDDTAVTENDGDGSISVPSVNSSDVVLDFIMQNSTNDVTPTGTNQTGQAAINQIFSAQRLECSTSTGNSGSVTMSWSGGASIIWQAGVRLIAAAGTPAGGGRGPGGGGNKGGGGNPQNRFFNSTLWKIRRRGN